MINRSIEGLKLIFFLDFFGDTPKGGNQRDLAREKNQKKQKEMEKRKGAQAKDGNKGTSLLERKQRDAEQMRLKQKKAEECASTATVAATAK